MTARRQALTLAFLLVACDAPTPTRDPVASASPGTASATNKPTGARPELVHPPAGTTDLGAFIRSEVARGQRDGRKVVVYVGASWCDPCVRFKAAIEDVRFVVTDLDTDGPALASAGCASTMVPLFARANADGTCSSKRTEGGIKGDGAVAFMLPRLKAVLVGD